MPAWKQPSARLHCRQPATDPAGDGPDILYCIQTACVQERPATLLASNLAHHPAEDAQAGDTGSTRGQGVARRIAYHDRQYPRRSSEITHSNSIGRQDTARADNKRMRFPKDGFPVSRCACSTSS